MNHNPENHELLRAQHSMSETQKKESKERETEYVLGEGGYLRCFTRGEIVHDGQKSYSAYITKYIGRAKGHELFITEQPVKNPYTTELVPKKYTGELDGIEMSPEDAKRLASRLRGLNNSEYDHKVEFDIEHNENKSDKENEDYQKVLDEIIGPLQES